MKTEIHNCECKGKGVIKTSNGNLVRCNQHYYWYQETWPRITKENKIEFINLKTGKIVN